MDDYHHKKGRTITRYLVNLSEKQCASLQRYFESLKNSGIHWENPNSKALGYKFDKGGYSEYMLLANNCTTFVNDALEYAMGDDWTYGVNSQFVPINMSIALSMNYESGRGLIVDRLVDVE